MMRIKVWIVILFLSGFFYTSAEAHSGSHGGLINEITMKRIVKHYLKAFAKKRKIDPSWKDLKKIETLELITLKGIPVWRFNLKNNATQDPLKNRLYFFITLHGRFLGASPNPEP